jgi:hypothetical protein
MNKEFVPYEESLALKELGFDEPCFGNYNNLTEITRFIFGKTNEGCLVYNKVPGTDIIVTSNERILAPLYQQAFRWVREKYGYLSFIDMDNYSYYRFNIYKGSSISEAPFETYEEAEFACLKKLIEIVKNNE